MQELSPEQQAAADAFMQAEAVEATQMVMSRTNIEEAHEVALRDYIGETIYGYAMLMNVVLGRMQIESWDPESGQPMFALTEAGRRQAGL